MNDKAELLHALNASKKAMTLLSSKKAFGDWEELLDSVFTELRDGKKLNTYVSCFCTDDDNLSQWRSYGGEVQGISVTFDRAKLSARLKQDKAKLYKVSYGKFSMASKLKDALAGELTDIAELDELLGPSPEEERRTDLLSRVSALLPKFKHLGFKDEREWRFVVQRDVAPSDLEFRVSKNKLVPFVMVGKAKALLPITSVRVGPGTDQELTAKSVEGFLRAKGHQVDVEISEVPFRP